jgi:lipoate-protein ligase B
MNQDTKAPAPSTILESIAKADLISFGLRDYGEVLRLQECLREQRQANAIPDTWLIGEHPAVITQGVRGLESDLDPSGGTKGAIPVFHIDRGGMTTLHSPGQLIIYPIVRVRGGSLAAGRLARELLAGMEAWLRRELGIEAKPLPRQPGLFVQGRKLLSIGISVRGGVSMHGIAMNVSNDLSLWNRIVPCGEPATRPVSLSQLLGGQIEPSELIPPIESWLAWHWGYRLVEPRTLVNPSRGI